MIIAQGRQFVESEPSVRLVEDALYSPRPAGDGTAQEAECGRCR